MAWETSIYDRTNISTWEYTDPNRVDNNSQYLKDFIEINIGIIVTLDAYTTQTINDLPTVGLINLLEKNINIIKDSSDIPSNWITLYENWVAGTNDIFIYTNANNLEIDQYLLKIMFESVILSYRQCFYYNSGTDFEF